MGQFRELSASRIAQIKAAMNDARKKGKGLAIDSETGELEGSASVHTSPDDKRNVIGKFDKHYRN